MRPATSLLCPVCDQLNPVRHPQPVIPLRCGGCGYLLRAAPQGVGLALPWALASAVLLATLAWLPLVSINKMGMQRAMRLADLGAALRGDGMAVLGWFVDACLLLAPAGLLGGILVLSVAVLSAFPFPGWRTVLSVVEWSRRWAMLEVLVLAILVSFLKISVLARASFEMGFVVLALGAVALLCAQQAFDVAEARKRLEDCARRRARGTPGGATGHHPGHTSLQPSWALLCAAAIALVPANALPIMEMTIGPTSSASTIFGGIVLLAEEGMWGIALIVFVASFIVPIAKLGGLAVLLGQARTTSGSAKSLRLHGWIDFIGRWSMLDILLIAVLAALVQFGSLAQVRPGPGAVAFAAVVILTIFAVEAFPLRRLFHDKPQATTPNIPHPVHNCS